MKIRGVHQNTGLSAVFLSVVIVLLGMSAAPVVWALTPQQQYFRAEKAYANLKNNPRQQKYRDKWLACIAAFETVDRLDPDGPWAAAGIFNAGRLYLELHKRSYLDADRQKAMDAFRQVLERFPQSRYAPRARSQIEAVGGAAPPAAPAVGNPKLLEEAYAGYDALMASASRQKYRDQWQRCIARFQKAYQSAPKGDGAAEALYMVGIVYQGMARISFLDADRKEALAYFQRVKETFPDSTFAGKATLALIEARVNDGERPGNDPNPLSRLTAADVQTVGDATDDDPPPRTSGLVTVEGLRFWSNPSYTRIVIDADQETNFSHRLLKKDHSLQKPQRLYIDLSKSRLSRDIQKFMPINDDLLSDARAGQYTAETVRIVVDIKSFKTYKIFSLKNPFRIVLDVWGQDADTSVAAPSPSTILPPSVKLPPSAIARQLALGVSRIVIDPGHGGKDYGAPGYKNGVHEKYIVLEIAKRLARKVEKELGCDVIMTRTTDRYLTLEERTAIANTQNADLFISIHTNAVRDKSAYGIETFFLNLATDDDAIRVAARENATSAKNISDLESILNDLMQNAKINESSRLAAIVQREMTGYLGHKFSHIRSKGVKQAPFYVLLGAQMPAILVETSFISNPRECQRLMSSKYQEALCNGIIRGIKTYIKETSPTAFADPPAAGGQPG